MEVKDAAVHPQGFCVTVLHRVPAKFLAARKRQGGTFEKAKYLQQERVCPAMKSITFYPST